MKIHRFADDWPMFSAKATKELAADIKANGLRQPLIKLGDELLDGRNRLKACEAADVKPNFVEYDGATDDATLLAFLESLNGVRRHLTVGERAAMAVKRKKRLKDARLPPTNSQLAKEFGVSERSIKQVESLAKNASPQLFKAVADGKLAPSDAVAVLDESKGTQAKIVSKAIREGTTVTKARDAVKPPKPGAQKSDPRLWDRWEDAFGKVRRLADDLGRSFPHANNQRAVVEKLNAAHATVQSWRKAAR